MAIWTITVRYGARYQRYHTAEVDAPDVREALRRAADEVPPEVAAEADLVEVRGTPDPDRRRYLGEED